MLINEKELEQSVRTLGAEATVKNLTESLRKGDLKPSDFSLRALFEALVPNGHEIAKDMEQGKRMNENMASVVAASTFSNITGQIFYNAILDGYRLAEYTVAPLFGVIQSNIITTQEKIAGISNIGDAAKPVGEYEEIPLASVSEDYVLCPQQRKFGLRIPISREAMVSDRTGVLLERCRALGEAMGLSREKEAVDTIIAPNGTTDRTAYNFRGTPYALWQTSNAAAPYYDNVITSNGLTDHQSINAAYKVLAAITDPYTGEPLADQGKYTLLHTPENRFTAAKLKESVQYRGISGSANFATNVSSGSAVVDFDTVASKYLASRLTAAGQATSNWYFGDFSRAFKWMRHLDITVEEAMPNSGLMFTNDIMMQFRVLRFETPSVHQPRVVAKNTA